MSDSQRLKMPNPVAINAKDLTFAYAKSLCPIIKIDDWQVQTGERLFLQGTSGAGKSTLLQLLCGLHIGSGYLKVAGIEFAALSSTKRDHFRARNIGVVFQQLNLIPYLSSVDNLLLAASFAGQKNEPARILAHSFLHDVGLESIFWNKPAHTLSIGQQQRVAIARAFINTPKLLFFDEPTSALDDPNQALFMKALTDYLAKHTDTTVIFVSHDARLASYFDKTIAFCDISSTHLTNDQDDQRQGRQ